MKIPDRKPRLLKPCDDCSFTQWRLDGGQTAGSWLGLTVEVALGENRST
jgi:hypothetical protein